MLDLSSARVAQFVVNVLAVGGGFLAGQLLAGLAAYLLDRWLTGGRSPGGLHKAARGVGGAALAVLVALIVFGHGEGWNLFGGGGGGDTNSPGTSPGTGGSGPAPAPPTARDLPSPVTRPIPPEADVAQVTLLGGDDVRDERFYLLDADPAPKTLAETRAALAARKQSAKAGLGLVIRFAPRNVLPRSHPAVLLLAQWAQDNGLAVTFPADAAP